MVMYRSSPSLSSQVCLTSDPNIRLQKELKSGRKSVSTKSWNLLRTKEPLSTPLGERPGQIRLKDRSLASRVKYPMGENSYNSRYLFRDSSSSCRARFSSSSLHFQFGLIHHEFVHPGKGICASHIPRILGFFFSAVLLHGGATHQTCLGFGFSSFMASSTVSGLGFRVLGFIVHVGFCILFLLFLICASSSSTRQSLSNFILINSI